MTPLNRRAYDLRTFQFDHRGRLVALTDELGRVLRIDYDGDRRCLRITDLEGQVHEVPWVPGGIVAEGRDPNTAERIYLSADREESLALPPLPEPERYVGAGGLTTYTYDAGGRLVSTGSDTLGRTTTYTYSREEPETPPEENPEGTDEGVEGPR